MSDHDEVDKELGQTGDEDVSGSDSARSARAEARQRGRTRERCGGEAAVTGGRDGAQRGLRAWEWVADESFRLCDVEA